MTFQSIGVAILVLSAVVIVGNIWFHFVDGIIEKIKYYLFGRNKQHNWHTLPPDEDDKNDI